MFYLMFFVAVLVSSLLMVFSPSFLIFMFILLVMLLIIFSSIVMNFLWISYLLCLVVLGGMMVMLIYSVMMTSDEEMDLKLDLLIFYMVSILTSSFMFKNFSLFSQRHLNLKNDMIFFILSFEGSMMIMFIMMVLFLSLVGVVDMLNNFLVPCE